MESSFFFGDHNVKSWLQQSVDGVLLQFFLGLLLLVAIFLAFNWASSYVLSVVTRRFLLTIGKKDWLEIIQASRVRRFFARALSLYLLSAMIDWLPLGPSFGEFLNRLIFAVATSYLLLCLSALLTVGHEIYARTPRAQVKSIKGYIEVIRIGFWFVGRSEEHTSELQSRGHLVCRLLLEKKKSNINKPTDNLYAERHPSEH